MKGVEKLRKTLGVGLAGILAYELPYLVRGPRTSLRIGETLEPVLAVQWATWSRGGYAAPFTEPRELPFFLGGVPGVVISSEVDANGLFCHFLPPYWAYVGIDCCSRFGAFLGMALLAQRFGSIPPVIGLATALAFAFLPYWVPAFFTVVGAPLLVIAFIECLRADGLGARPRRTSLAIALAGCAAFPFFSSLVYTGVFLLVAAGVVWAILATLHRRLLPAYLTGLGLLALAFAVANRGLVALVIHQGMQQWQRAEFVSAPTTPAQAIGDLVFVLRSGTSYGPTLAFPFLWIAIGASVVLARWWRERDREHYRDYLIVASVTGALCGAYVFADAATGLLGSRLPWINRFALTRLVWLLPVPLYLLFAFAITALWRQGGVLRALGVALLVLQMGRNVYRSEWIYYRHLPSFEAYVGAGVFDRAEAAIGRPRRSFRIACLGFPPSMAHFNGYWTVDGYWYLYPLEYKRRFERVIAGELARDPDLARYFRDWGNRAYLFSSELWRSLPDRYTVLASKSTGVTRIERLDIDTTALADLGASYIFSAVDIGNAGALGLAAMGTISDPEASVDLHLYRLQSASSVSR